MRSGGWFLFSDKRGMLPNPAPVRRLPGTARISGDGKWAEFDGDAGKVERVFVWIDDARQSASAASPEQRARRLREAVA